MSKAILRGVRLSPKKSRLIARQVQGMNCEYALASLEFTPNKAAKIIYKVLASAIANGDFQPEEAIVTSCRVDEGSVLKRFRPRARGTASKIRKPTAHITVIVDRDNKKEDFKNSKSKTLSNTTKVSANKDVSPSKDKITDAEKKVKIGSNSEASTVKTKKEEQ